MGGWGKVLRGGGRLRHGADVGTPIEVARKLGWVRRCMTLAPSGPFALTTHLRPIARYLEIP